MAIEFAHAKNTFCFAGPAVDRTTLLVTFYHSNCMIPSYQFVGCGEYLVGRFVEKLGLRVFSRAERDGICREKA